MFFADKQGAEIVPTVPRSQPTHIKKWKCPDHSGHLSRLLPTYASRPKSTVKF